MVSLKTPYRIWVLGSKLCGSEKLNLLLIRGCALSEALDVEVRSRQPSIGAALFSSAILTRIAAEEVPLGFVHVAVEHPMLAQRVVLLPLWIIQPFKTGLNPIVSLDRF